MLRSSIQPCIALLLFTCCGVQIAVANGPATLRSSDVVAFLGGTNLIQLQREGTLEACWARSVTPERPRFRDFGWDGDTVERQGTVIERWREDKFGDLAAQLDSANVTLVVLQFGQSEALDPLFTPTRFQSALGRLFDQIGARRVILLTPTPLENKGGLLPDLRPAQARLERLVEVMAATATQREAHFVDLVNSFAGKAPLTENGVHVLPSNQQRVAREIAKQLQLAPVREETGTAFTKLRHAIVAKHALWQSYWRPPNWKCLYGDDGEREFGKATAGGQSLRQEWSELPQMVAGAEATIWKLTEATP